MIRIEHSQSTGRYVLCTDQMTGPAIPKGGNLLINTGYIGLDPLIPVYGEGLEIGKPGKSSYIGSIETIQKTACGAI